MTALQALNKSIKHWEMNCKLAEEYIGKTIKKLYKTKFSFSDTNCECCGQFRSPILDDCKNCPISIVSGTTICKSTPYYSVAKIFRGTVTKKYFSNCILEYWFLLFVREAKPWNW